MKPRIRAPAPVVYTDYYTTDVPLKLEWDKTDNLLDPTRGYRITGQATPEFGLGGTSPANILSTIDASIYQSAVAPGRDCRSGASRFDLRWCLARSGAVTTALCRRRRQRARLFL